MNDDHNLPIDDDDEPLPQRAAHPQAVEPETIGPLVFVPNPDYPYPFEVEQPPHFWMEETTGVLNEAVDAYLNGERISAEQLAVIKVYLKQFIERAKLAGAANRRLLLSKIDKLRTTAEIERFADEVSEYGAELF